MMMPPLTSDQKKLVEENLGLARWHVERLLRRYPARRRFRDDLVQEATLAMMAASRTFDPRIARFTTYCKRPVESAIYRYSLKQRSVVGFMFAKDNEGRVQPVPAPTMTGPEALENVSEEEAVDFALELDAGPLAERIQDILVERMVAAWRRTPSKLSEARFRWKATKYAKSFLAQTFGIGTILEVAAEYGIHRNCVAKAAEPGARAFAVWARELREEA